MNSTNNLFEYVYISIVSTLNLVQMRVNEWEYILMSRWEWSEWVGDCDIVIVYSNRYVLGSTLNWYNTFEFYIHNYWLLIQIKIFIDKMIKYLTYFVLIPVT